MIDQLRQKISRAQMEYSLHAVRQMIARDISPEGAHLATVLESSPSAPVEEGFVGGG